jgi:low temperature requirement protein LtrA
MPPSVPRMPASGDHLRRISAVHREGDERVTPLELFFDLVFVLCITQCSTLMEADPTWHGVGKGLLVLAVLWWGWEGYAWFTSVLDPEEGMVRGAMFAVMAAFLVAAMAVPQAFGDLGLTFAIAYAVVRVGHLVLFGVASRGIPALRRSVWTGLVPSTLVGVALLVGASQVGGAGKVGLWVAAIGLDVAGPFIFGAEGWHLVPRHFAERHGLIFLIALGESIAALGRGADHGMTAGLITAAVIGVACCAAMWWAYFDVVALVAERRLSAATIGREQNELARDSYSLLHYPMVAGVVLVAFGLRQTLAHEDQRLASVPAAALVGGMAVYLLAHVAFRLRNVRSVNRQRLLLGLVLLAAVPVAHRVDAIVALAGITVLLWALIGYEATRFAAARDAVRHAGHDLPPS